MTTPAETPADRNALLHQALASLEAGFARSLRAAIPSVASELERLGELERDQAGRQSLYAVAAMLRIEVRARVLAASRTLRERALRCIEFLERAGDDGAALELIEEEELRVQILAAELARAVRQLGADDYLGYAARTRALRAGLWEDDEVNPLGARTLAAAAQAAFAGLGEAGAVAAGLRAALAAHLPPALVGAVEETDRWLRAHGVEAPLADAGQADGAAARASQAPVQGQDLARGGDQGAAASEAQSAGDVPHQLLATEQAARTSEFLGSSPFAAPSARPKLSVVPTLQPVVEIERDALAFAHSIGVVPYSRQARAGFFGKARARLHGAGVPPAQTAVVDLVAAMFDYVVDDQRIPEAAKPLIWRLQQPSVALSLLDPAYLGDEPRSLRRLVENVGAIVNAFADDISRGSELYRRLDTVVRAVEIVAGALQTRSAVMARQVEQEYERAARNVSQLIERVVQERTSLEETPGRRNRRDYRNRPDRAREQEVTERLSALLVERLGRHEVPDSVRDFVLNVWLRHLRTAILRDGEESSEYTVSLQVVDDLLWSLDEGKERQSRSQLAQKIPPLIRLLAQGLRAIGARDDEFKPFFDELFLIHLRKMQRRRRNGDTRTGEGLRTRSGRRTRIRGDTASGAFDTGPGAQEPSSPGAPQADADGAQSAGEQSGGSDSGGQQSQDPQPKDPQSGSPQSGSPQSGSPQSEGDGGRLLEVLASLDLGDLPAAPRERVEDAEQALASLRRGDWLRLGGDGDAPVHAKVAWINARRTVVLLVRQPDRRALSLRSAELLERLREGRAARLV
ncbi:MAG: DUF1631 family protein [Gammaproteobacteria bacterium]